MKLSAINNISMTANMSATETQPKKKFTDRFQNKLKNSADMSDCISVPRTIFKGYLGIMSGTTLMTAGAFIKNAKVKSAMSIAGLATSLYGTWSFVRPYILKDSVPTVNLNEKK